MPSAIPLHRLAMQLRQHYAGKIALMVDLSAIPNIHSGIMFRSMARFIEERTLGETIDAVPLARNILVMLAPQSVISRLRERLEVLSTELQEQRQGSLGLRQFDLENQADLFVETARRLMEQAPVPRSEHLVPILEDAPPDSPSLNRIIDLHRILGHADLANQCRRQTIWKLEPHLPPIAMADEIWVSISALERVTGMPLRGDIWLFAKATELLDHCMIAQILSENGSLQRPVSFNLHLATILSTTFLRLIIDKPAAQVSQMMVEIPLVEWRTNRNLSETARRILRQHGIHLCLDGIRPEDVASLTDAEWETADFLKFDAAAEFLSQQTAKLQSLLPTRLPLLQRKAIFCHCDATGAVGAGLGVGIRHFQGRGLTPLLEDPHEVETLLGIETAKATAAVLKGVSVPR